MPFIAALVVLLCFAVPCRAQSSTATIGAVNPADAANTVVAVDEAPVPAAGAVLFTAAESWQRYELIAAALLIVLQAALIVTLLLQRSRRRQVESALIESQQRYSLASAAGAVGIWDWNFETNELFIDSRLKSLLGFDDAEISTRPQDWGSRVHQQDLADSGAAVQACLDGHTDTYQVEHRMLHKNGSVRWMLSRGSAIRGADGRVRRLVGTKVDITDRKEAEESNREHQAVLRSSHQQIHDLAGLLIASQEVERARIARELHDDLSQQTAGLSIGLSALKRRLAAQAETSDLSGDIASLQERALGLAEHIRHLSHDSASERAAARRSRGRAHGALFGYRAATRADRHGSTPARMSRSRPSSRCVCIE